MNVDEVLKYEATKGLKESNKQRQDADQYDEQQKKKVKMSAGGSLEHLSDKEKLEVLKILENDTETENFDESSLKKLLNQFEKRFTKNQEMRIKFSENPEKFMDSEIELNDTIQEMHVISTRPEFYPTIVELNTIQYLLNLMSHENIDICASVVGLIQELTDLESSIESLENIKILVDLLCEQQIFQLLVSNLERFDEKNKDESEAVHNALAIVENIIELKPNLNLDDSKQGLLQWLLKRIKIKRVFDNNKLYAVEILAILVQNSDENRKILGDLDGIDILLQQIAYYKRHNPGSADEYEYMENLFDCLCSCLMLGTNRIKFLKGEGLQLMRLILREQKNARNSALKVLSYAMNNLDGKENCEAFVDMTGLGILFPLFMKPASSNKKNNSNNNEEHIVAIIASLLKNCNDSNKQRVMNKFVENDFEKIDRLLELYFQYLEQVENIEESNEEDSDDETEFYMKKLDNGLYALHSIVYIILDISANGIQPIKTRVLKLLNLRNSPKSKLISIIKEYEDNLGDEESSSSSINEEKERIKQLIEKF